MNDITWLLIAGISYGINKIVGIKRKAGIEEPAEEIIVALNTKPAHLQQKASTEKTTDFTARYQ